MALHYKMDQEQRAKQFAPFNALEGYTDTIKEKEKDNLEFNGQVPVSVLASFNDKGEVIPLYFGFERNRIKIDHIVWSTKGAWGKKYRCEITDEEYVKTVDLIFYKEYDQWKLKV